MCFQNQQGGSVPPAPSPDPADDLIRDEVEQLHRDLGIFTSVALWLGAFVAACFTAACLVVLL